MHNCAFKPNMDSSVYCVILTNKNIITIFEHWTIVSVGVRNGTNGALKVKGVCSESVST